MQDRTGQARDLVGYNGRLPKVVWPDNARVAVSIVVNYEEGSERAFGDGDPDGELGGAAPGARVSGCCGDSGR